MKTITAQELEIILTNVKGYTFIELEYTKIEIVKKRGNTKFIEHPVIKNTKINVGFNGSYQNSVNNRLYKKDIEQTFISEPLPWGKWKVPNKIIEHNGNIYVRFYLHKNTRYESVFSYNGKVIEGTELYEFISVTRESTRQTEAGLAVEEQNKPLTMNITNINSITLNKVTYIIE